MLCEAAPALVSAGSQLTLCMLEGKWAFLHLLPKPTLEGKLLLNLEFPASRRCWERTGKFLLNNQLPLHIFFPVAEENLWISPLLMPAASIQVRDLNTCKNTLCS